MVWPSSALSAREAWRTSASKIGNRVSCEEILQPFQPINYMTEESTIPAFADLGLSQPILEALQAVGYETPSPIQAQTIPVLLSGADLLGQAQTGTGKTAAFALPILAKIDLTRATPQALVLVPTRELAIQVAEAFQRYAARLKGF